MATTWSGEASYAFTRRNVRRAIYVVLQGQTKGGGGLTLVGVVVVLHVAKVLRVFGNPQPVPVTRVFGPVLVKLAFAVRSWRAGWAGDR